MTHHHDFQRLIRTWWVLLFSGILLAFTCWLTGCNKPTITPEPGAYIVSGPGSRKAIYSGRGELIAVIDGGKQHE